MDEPKQNESRPKRSICGWREWAQLPDLGVHEVKVKVDTGARTSALHAEEISVVHGEQPMVRFRAYPSEASPELSSLIEVPLLEEREVKSSNGQTERRPVIETLIVLGEERWRTEVTLTTRDEMGFRMLLGRTALRRRFLVDAGRSFACGGGDKEHSAASPETSHE